MSTITNVWCALTQEALNAFCNMFHILEEVHHVLPNQDATMHERHAVKIELYTRFFDFANFRLPLSTFLVDILRHFRINISQLSVIGAAKERDDDEPWLLETTVGRTVPLLLVAPNCACSELEASGDRDDHGTLSGTFIGGKSRSSLQRLLAGAMLNAEVGVTVVPTLPFVTASVSTMPEREDGDHTNSVAKPNLRTIGAPSSILVMTTATTVTSMVDSTLVAKEKTFKPSLFATDSSSASGADPNTGIFFDLTGSDFLSMTNGSRLDDGHVFPEMVNEFAPLKFFTPIRGMKHEQLFTEFNAKDGEIKNLKAQMLLKEAEPAESIRLRAEASNFETMEKSLQDEVNALKERNTILEKERNALDVKATDPEASTMDTERELTNLNVQLTHVKSQNDILVDQVHELEVSFARIQDKLSSYENLTKRLEEFQDAQLKIVNDKFDKLYADFVEVALHLEEKFYSHLLTIIFDRMWLLTHGMELALVNCLHSPEYLFALGAAVGKAIKNGMQDGLSAGIIHGKEGRVLTDSNKDASIETVIDILRLENPLVEKLGLTELQPHVDQLMVPIHHSPDKVVVGASALSLALDVSSISIQKIRENIVNHISALRDVLPLADPFFAVVLTGLKGTSNVMPTIADTITALSTTLVSASTIAPIYVDDYEVMGTDDQARADGMPSPL
nr:transposase (putative), gypsy type [Tanacetum cinerariifolium]